MPDLTFSVAQNLAASLVTIGHPYQQAAVNATAMDLVKWCKGRITDGGVQSPEQQAEALIDEVRTTWTEWPQGGTRALLELFQGKYAPRKTVKPVTEEDMRARGLIDPPCEVCDGRLYVGEAPNLNYCITCRAGRHNARWDGEQGLRRLNTQGLKSQVPVTNLTYQQLQERAQAIYEEEQRRKRAREAEAADA